MLIDLQNLMSDSQDLAVVASTVLCTNPMDLGTAGTVPAGFQARGTPKHDLGAGSRRPMLIVQVDQTFTSAGAATLKVQLITDDAAALSSPTILQSSEVIALATLVAGYRFRLAIPEGVLERYLGVQYVIGTATTTAGKCSAWLGSEADTWK